MVDRITGNSHEKKLQKSLDKMEKTIPETVKEEKQEEVKWVRPEASQKPEPRRSLEYQDTMILHTDISDSVLGDDTDRNSSHEEDKDRNLGDAVLGEEGVDWEYLFKDEDNDRSEDGPNFDDDFDR